MAVNRCDDVTVAFMFLEPGFLFDVIDNVRPFLERVVDVRAAILANALDSTRKDQKEWMHTFENMLVEGVGQRARFMPPQGGVDVPEPRAKPVAAASTEPRIPITG